MVDFKIRRGLSTTLFTESGIVNPRLVIEEGCWYLCSDTAELFLGVQGKAGLTLKKINGENAPAEDTPETNPGLEQTLADLEFAVATLQDDISSIKEIKLFEEISDYSELPDVSADNFNPNITYYIQHPERNTIATYIYNEKSNKYVCLNNVVDQEVLGIVKAEINADGELVIYYSNDSISNLGKIVGKDGSDGLVTSIKIGDKIYSHKDGIIELPDFSGYATEDFVRESIMAAELGGKEVDLSKYATKEDLDGLATEDYVDEKFAAIEMPSKIILMGGDATPEND